MQSFTKNYVTIALLLVVAQVQSSAVLIFGWSDTSVSSVDEGLKKQGIESSAFERFDSSDKGLGIAIVTSDQAEAYKKYCESSKLLFANIHTALPGISEIGDLQVSFDEGSENGNIKFGKSEDAYSGIITDDPSKVVSGDPEGKTTSGDAMWSTESGKTAEIVMYDEGGRQYVKMDAVGKGGNDGKPDDDDDDDKPDDDNAGNQRDKKNPDEKPQETGNSKKPNGSKKIAGLDQPCGGPKDRQCAEGLECVKFRDNPTGQIKEVTHICKEKGSKGTTTSGGQEPEGEPTKGKPPKGKPTPASGKPTPAPGKPTPAPGDPATGSGSKGNCRIAVLVDQSFAQSHGDNAEQAIKDIVKGTSDVVNGEFGITLSIESIDFEKGLKRRDAQTEIGNHFKEWSQEIPNRENLCFVVGFTVKDMGRVGGFSPVGAACRGATMVVKNEGDKPNYVERGIRVFTHEIGHMLGAHHDADTSCGQTDFIMGSTKDNKFSKCSMDAITSKLGDYKCLLNADGNPDDKPDDNYPKETGKPGTPEETGKPDDDDNPGNPGDNKTKDNYPKETGNPIKNNKNNKNNKNKNKLEGRNILPPRPN